jgi:hypothetical protein
VKRGRGRPRKEDRHVTPEAARKRKKREEEKQWLGYDQMLYERLYGKNPGNIPYSERPYVKNPLGNIPWCEESEELAEFHQKKFHKKMTAIRKAVARFVKERTK